MRDIKFRAWDTEKKEWVDTGFIQWQSGGFYIYVEIKNMRGGKWILVEDDSFQINQSTGYKDKNGKEIYENDIIEYKGMISSMRLGRPRRAVDWSDRRCGFNPMIYWFGQGEDEVEIVGNIYENPKMKLLEVKK